MQGSGLLIPLWAVVWLATTAGAQPLIEHRDVRCMSSESFTQFLATIRPPEDVRTAKLYFRSYLYPDFYYIELSIDNGVYHGVLPIPSEETLRVVYYIEAIDAAFNTSRSEEYVIDVDGRCRPGPDAALFTGSEPAIVVGATKTGLAALPPGFQAAGIGGFITAAGTAATAAGGGGLGAAGIAIGAAAGAAAGVGVVVAKKGGEGSTTSTSAVTTIPLGGGSTTTIGANTTTTSSGGGGGSSTTTVAPSSTTSIPASTTIPTTTTSIPLVACFTWSAQGNCRMRFDSCSTPTSAITSYTWRMMGPPPNLDIGSTPGFSFDFSLYDPRCTGTMTFNRPIRLTVTDGEGNFEEEQQNVDINPNPALKSSASGRMRVQLLPTSSDASAMILMDGFAKLLDGASPMELEAPPSSRTLDIEARAVDGLGTSALIAFELDGGLRLGPVLLGRVEWQSERRIVFRLSGSGETLRFQVKREEGLTEGR